MKFIIALMVFFAANSFLAMDVVPCTASRLEELFRYLPRDYDALHRAFMSFFGENYQHEMPELNDLSKASNRESIRARVKTSARARQEARTNAMRNRTVERSQFGTPIADALTIAAALKQWEENHNEDEV